MQAASADEQQGNRPSPHQQVSRPSNEAGANPHPIQAPRDHQPIQSVVDDNKNNDDTGMAEKESISDVGFVKRDGNIVPAGPDDLDPRQKESAKASLPLPYRYKDDNYDRKNNRDNGVESVGDPPPKPALSAPIAKNHDPSSPGDAKISTSKEPRVLKPSGLENSQIRPEGRQQGAHVNPPGLDEIQDLQNKVAGILNHEK